MNIHKTTIIHDGVELGSNIIIGEYTIIYSGTTIHDNVKIGSHCSIGSNPEIINNQVTLGLVINKNTTITDHVSINLGTDKDTFIGEGCYIMNHSYIAHDVEVGDRSIIAPGTKVLGRAVLGKEVYLGANSVVHQETVVGELTLLAAGSFCKGILDSCQIYAGSPAKPKKINQVGIQRSKINKEEIENLINNIDNSIT